jgi:hypothetical protein
MKIPATTNEISLVILRAVSQLKDGEVHTTKALKLTTRGTRIIPRVFLDNVINPVKRVKAVLPLKPVEVDGRPFE